jgi:hypothetical protein
MESNENIQPTAYEVKDDDNLNEQDLKKSFLFGGEDDQKTGDEPGMEGSPAGGQRFGENSETPAGDDKNNPSQLVGYDNAYLSRDEPSEDNPANNNFKDPNQLGQPNYAQAADAANTGQSDAENTGPQKDEENDKGINDGADINHQEDTDGEDVNIPGPNELPDQLKVGE